jgi:glycosyltransferase involved in cell wall biosynthesis
MIGIVITSYGDDGWREMAWSRAYPSASNQGVKEIIVHHEPELEIGPARNAAAALATSRYLLFLDADDELEPGYVEAMRAAIKASQPRPTMKLYQPTVRYMRKGVRAQEIMRPNTDLRRDNFLVIGTVVSRTLFNKVNGFSDYPHGFEDWSLWAKCWNKGAQIVQVPEAIYIAHINPRSKHRQMWRNRREQVAMHNRIQAELFPRGHR